MISITTTVDSSEPAVPDFAPAAAPQVSSLRHQMLGVFSLVISVFALALAFFVDYKIVDAGIDARGKQAASEASLFANMIDESLNTDMAHIKARANRLGTGALRLDPLLLQPILDGIQAVAPHFSWIGVTDARGVVVSAAKSTLVGVDASERPWFQASRRAPVFMDVHNAKLLENVLPRINPYEPLRFVDLAAPGFDGEGNLVGVLAVHLGVEWLSAKLDSFAGSRFQASQIHPAVIGADGVVRFGDSNAVAGIDRSALWAMAEFKKRGWVEKAPNGEGPTIYGFARNGGPDVAHNSDWVTVVPVSVATVRAELAQTRLLALSGVVLVSLVAWITLYFLLDLTNRPVRLLMRQVRSAQKSREILPRMEGLPKEFSEIQDVVNEFLESLQGREAALQSALAELRASFSGVTATFPGVLFRLEAAPDGRAEITYLSSSAKRYLNVDPQELPLPVWQMFARYEPEIPMAEPLSQVMSRVLDGRSIDMTFEAVGESAVRRHLRVKAQMLESRPRGRVWQGVIFNVSDLVAAQQAAAHADEAKSKFLATMSHEIRTPLNGIFGFSQLLHEELENDQHRADVRKIIDTTELLSRILNDILDFSKIEEGKFTLDSHPFSLEVLVTSTAALFEAQAAQKGVQLVVNLPAPMQANVLGDPTRLKQVLNNLLSNAMKFTSQGTVQLDVSVEMSSPLEAKVSLNVSDTGIGMPAESLDKLFQRFEQADESIYRRYGGSGLGLAIVKGIIAAMHGSITVESTPGRGTVFRVNLPIQVAPDEAPVTQATLTRPTRHLNVLVVDDVANNRELLCRMLRSCGHTATEACDGQQAVSLANASAYDLILMDIDMPVMDGLEASRLIRSTPGACRQSKIIALSGHAYEEDVRKAKDSGIDDHLAKPVVFAKLKQKISDVVD